MNQNEQPFRLPGLGSHFAYKDWTVDTNGEVTFDRQLYTSDITSDTLVEGKRCVVVRGISSDRYQALEPNGNLSWCDGYGWNEVPVATRNALIHTWYDSGHIEGLIKNQIIETYLGTELLTLAGRNFNTVKVAELQKVWVDTVEAPPMGSGLLTICWYAPELGVIVHDSTPALWSGSWWSSTGGSLNSYEVK